LTASREKISGKHGKSDPEVAGKGKTYHFNIFMKVRSIILIITILSFIGENHLYGQDIDIRSVYIKSGLTDDLPYQVFEMAMKGLSMISTVRNRQIITIIDYSKSSSSDRFYVIDLVNNRLLYKTLVAHGRNTGEAEAEHFSNIQGSEESCLGFFLTAETYDGKNGYSLSLDGLEPSINDNARARAIVIHGADYVNRDFIEKHGRLGRSWGCPALPDSISKEIIDKISNGSCLFIYGNDPEYFKNSKILNDKSEKKPEKEGKKHK
jgi:hypothetical protein